MQIKQVSTIINAAYAEATGSSAMSVKDTTGLMAMGDTLLDSSNSDSKDKFVDALVDRIGRTVISSRLYAVRDKSLVYHSFEFGAILQKLYVAPLQGEDSAQWNLSNGQSLASFVIAKPTVEQDLFRNLDTWTVTVTIPDQQLKSAFEGFEQMAAFIDAVWVSVESSLNAQIEIMTDLCYTGFIGERLVDANGTATMTVVDLLGDYNTTVNAGNPALTAAQAIYSLDFLKYAAQVIDKYTGWLEKQSVLFNRKTNPRVRHTPKDLQRLTVLDQFASAMKFYLQADTYHKELVEMPGYVETPYWQSPDQDYTFEHCSTVNVVTPKTGYTVSQDGVVAILTDYEAIGVLMDNRRTRSQYLPNEEANTFFNKVDKGYFGDLSENGVIFLVTDSIATPVAP